ncbi:MAG: hypothetical protein ACYC7J_18465 [Syntrophales bacterium]
METSNRSPKRSRHRGLLPAGYVQFITLFGNILLIVPIVLMGVMYGIAVGFQEGTRMMVTMYESVLGGSKKGAS